MTFSLAIRTELKDLVERKHKTSLQTVAKEMGRSHIWLSRKLDDESGQPRSMSLADIDAVLEHIEEDPRALLKAALAAK